MRCPPTLAFVLWLWFALGANLFAQAQRGQPWSGPLGSKRTMSDIMAEEKRKPKRVKPRVHPEHDGPRPNRPQNPQSPLTTTANTMAAAEQIAPLAAQTLSTSFTGATLADTQAIPPDSMGAIGPSQFLVVVNGRIRSFNKNTGAADGILNADTDVFFSSVLTTPGSGQVTFTSDPRVRYDRLSGRWIIVMIDVTENPSTLAVQAPNRVLLAVSDGAILSASTVWTFFYFQQDAAPPAGDTGRFADYPTLGIDANACYIGVAEFTSTRQGTTAFVVRKSSILSGGPVVVTAFRNLTGTATGPGPENPQGVDNFDGSVSDGYLIGPDNATFGTLMLRRISNPGGTPTISANIALTVPATSLPQAVPHLGNTGGTGGYLDAIDDRLMMATIRKGHLWGSHSINVTTSGMATSSSSTHRDAARWYDIANLATTPSLVQSGTVFDPASTNSLNYWMSSIAVSGQGHAVLGFTLAGPNSYADAAFTGRLASDSAGTMNAPVRFTASNSSYNPSNVSPRRWGDYSFTSVDSDDDMTMWTIQEFCDAANSYAVRVAKLLAPPPAQPSACSPSSIARGAQNVTVNVTATSSNGSGLFDPGNGFPKHLSATISGTGVTVNGVIFIDATHASLNVTVAPDAALTSRTITMINPDGQQATSASALLNILASADLGISGTASPDPVAAGYQLKYHLVLANYGPNSAASVTAALTIPGTLVSSTPAPATQNGANLSYNLSTLASGANTSIDLTVAIPVNASGSASLTGLASSDATDSNSANNSVTITINILADSDGDRLPDVWENAHGLNASDPTDAAIDSDGDGLTNLQEYIAGTDPQNGSSFFSARVTRTGTDVQITFPTLNGRTYRVQETDDLAAGPWANLGVDLAGTGQDISVSDAGAIGNARRFYRVLVFP